jgi:BlaI family penicillinase repressor
MADRQYELGTAELEVLNHLHKQGRLVAYTTVLTFLTRLEQKGYVVSDKSELAYVYRAAVSRDRVTRSRLRDLVQNFFDGASGRLALQLVRTSKFTPEEVSELQKLIDELETKTHRDGA